MKRSQLVVIFFVFASVFAAGASCGQRTPSTTQTPSQSESPAQEERAVATPQSDSTAADAVPLPQLPRAHAESITPRQAPPIGTLDEAYRALNQGYYDAASNSVEELMRSEDSNQVWFLRARLDFEQGRYTDAVEAASRAARDASLRIVANTHRAESLMALGRLDQAESILRELHTEETAHRARVMLGRLLRQRGRMAEAEPILMRVIGAYNDGNIDQNDAEGLSYVAMAAWELGSARDANDAFMESNRADSQRVETQLEWARLFLMKYDTGHAEESVRAALEINPEHPVARVLLARIVIEQSFDFASAEEHLTRAMRVNPNLVMAHVTRAGMALRDLDIAAADQHLDRALQINPHDLEALSTRAAVRYLADDEAGFQQAKREVLRRHRTYSELYNIIGRYAEWEHRYPDIVRMSREAVTLNSEDYRAHAALGLNLLRMGDEEEALSVLQSAWRRDRFNVRVYNTLNLYDDVLPRNYEEFQSGPFMFRMHKEERPILQRYVPRTLERAYRDMVRRYGFTPEGPVRIELFANPGHFSVRTTGLPNLGVQGVCFGKVVTAISPRGGPFNWGQITWHELAHVFHIQLSRNRVPRWFTEGLAEYETLIARRQWRREMDHYLWQALERDRLPSLALMNRAFTRARSPMDMMVGYYASTRIVKYIADQHGFDKIPRMLREWGRGRRAPEVVQAVLNMDIDELDRNYRAFARQRMQARQNDFRVDFSRFQDLDALRAAVQNDSENARKQAHLAAGLLVHGQVEEATQVVERALGLDENESVARFVAARLALMQRDGQSAERHLRAILASGKDGYEVRLLLARAALGREDNASARRELEAATGIDPDRAEAWQGLVEIAQRDNDQALKLRALSKLVYIEEHDREIHIALLRLLAETERWDDALSVGEHGTFVDPANAEVHFLLARAYLEKDEPRDALYELDSALIVGHDAPGEVHLLRASAYQKLNRPQDAREAARAALSADASLEQRARPYLGGNE